MDNMDLSEAITSACEQGIPVKMPDGVKRNVKLRFTMLDNSIPPQNIVWRHSAGYVLFAIKARALKHGFKKDLMPWVQVSPEASRGEIRNISFNLEHAELETSPIKRAFTLALVFAEIRNFIENRMEKTGVTPEGDTLTLQVSHLMDYLTDISIAEGSSPAERNPKEVNL